MGYSTTFTGKITLSRMLNADELAELRRIYEDPQAAGKEAPETYLQWVPTPDGDGIAWDGVGKFQEYVAWMLWLCQWFAGRGISADGDIAWIGEDPSDRGLLRVRHNHALTTDHPVPWKAERAKKTKKSKAPKEPKALLDPLDAIRFYQRCHFHLRGPQRIALAAATATLVLPIVADHAPAAAMSACTTALDLCWSLIADPDQPQLLDISRLLSPFDVTCGGEPQVDYLAPGAWACSAIGSAWICASVHGNDRLDGGFAEMAGSAASKAVIMAAYLRITTARVPANTPITPESQAGLARMTRDPSVQAFLAAMDALLTELEHGAVPIALRRP